jgi:hypothetical protein
MAGYSGTPLVKKIGIKTGHRVVFVDAPNDFAATLGELPPDTKLATKNKRFDVAIVFVTKSADLDARIRSLQPFLEQNGMIWAAWPKKASGVPTDLVEDKVRDLGLAAGLVDVKVCAIDDTWSGLKFVIRLADRQETEPAKKIAAGANGGAKRATKAKKAAAR